MVLEEYVDFRNFKRKRVSISFSHMAFCVLSLPGFWLLPASQLAILLLWSGHMEKKTNLCAQRTSVYDLVFSNFHNGAICTGLNHLHTQQIYAKMPKTCYLPPDHVMELGICCFLLSRWLLSSIICGWKCLAFLSSSSPECLEQIFTQEFKHLSVLGQISVRTYAYSI